MTGQLCDAQEIAESRAKIYQLLAAVYLKPPDADFLQLLVGWVSSSVGTEGVSQLLSEPMRQSLTLLDSLFKEKKESSWEEFGEAVSVEFTRLFRGVKPHYSPPPPYESVYQEETRHVFGNITTEVRREYRRFGLDLAEGFSGEPPDHISFELEFVHQLCHQEAEAWERGDEEEVWRLLCAEREFVTEHLGAWLPKFCDKVREYDRLGLFRGLADLTEGWVTFDYEQHLQEVEPFSSKVEITDGYSAMESD